ncbi:MAG TPA: hypothetical protein VFC78_06650 [Tepidisphaeraceae bacterium]|nr:hypothetical protein [Tepidisphaeraceae bacterium]
MPVPPDVLPMTATSLPPASRYARWKAPIEDGGTLIWPAPADLLNDARENHRLLSSADSARLQNVSLPEVRRRMRRWLGHEDDERPIIATGHQAELHHSGVWVKNALINAAADRLGGRAMHFAVDTDEPKHLSLRWPGGSLPLSDDPRTDAAWSGLLPAPTPAHLARVADDFDRAARSWDFKPLAPQFLQSMSRLALEAQPLPAALTNAVHELDWSLGLRHDAMLVSPLCWSEPYLLFVHHVLSRADAFAADYNAALEEYRRENKVRAPGRPMPNLQCSADGCEVPFWLDDIAAGKRSRATVLREQGHFVLQLPDGERFVFDANADGWEAAGRFMFFCRRHGVRLAPRALTLTAVLRLLAADQFVHGIGGGLYDQVLDKLIARHFQIQPPRFSVTTATLYFPSVVGQSRVCLPCLAQQGHRLRHSILGPEKRKWVEAIAAEPRNSMQRASLFSRMHEQLAGAQSQPRMRQWNDRFEAARVRAQQEKVLFDRELFYAIQPAERLAGMIQTYRSAMDA